MQQTWWCWICYTFRWLQLPEVKEMRFQMPKMYYCTNIFFSQTEDKHFAHFNPFVWEWCQNAPDNLLPLWPADITWRQGLCRRGWAVEPYSTWSFHSHICPTHLQAGLAVNQDVWTHYCIFQKVTEPERRTATQLMSTKKHYKNERHCFLVTSVWNCTIP